MASFQTIHWRHFKPSTGVIPNLIWNLLEYKVNQTLKDMYVYILTNKTKTTLYIGVTNNIDRRVYEHKHQLLKGFSFRYCLNKLVHIETYPSAQEAIRREKQLKAWKRQWKNELIEKDNPEWKDLYLP